jgi:hypothetical protein
LDLLCECSKPGCWELLRVSAGDYEHIRRFPTRFLVRRNHASDDTERIVGERSGFVIVEKVGSDAELAIRSDPRKLNDQPSGPPDPDPADARDGRPPDPRSPEPAATSRAPDETETIIRHRSPPQGGAP